jgi:N utilization substance protein B
MGLVLTFLRESRETPEAVTEAEDIFQGAFAARARADALMAGESRHWDVGRMALVDRNILRLALWELLVGRAGKKVVISEALRLAKEFSSAESARFINGVLDAAARRIQEDAGSDAGKGGRDAGDATAATSD